MTQYNVTGVSNISNMRTSRPTWTQLRRQSKKTPVLILATEYTVDTVSTQLTSRGCRCALPSLPTYYTTKYTFWYLLKTECTYKNSEKSSKHFTTNLEYWYNLFRRIYYTFTFEKRRSNI